MIEAVIVDPASFVKAGEILPTVEGIHEALGCDLFDVTSVSVRGRIIDVYCDDEGLFKENPIPTIADVKGNVRIVGKCFFAGHDSDGNTVSISKADREAILSRVRLFSYGGRYYEGIVCDKL